jgi:hypothetical protein
MSGAESDRYYEVFNQVERYVEDTWHVPVVLRDVPDPFAGDLDGAEIHVDYSEDAENALFILVHCSDTRSNGT